MSETFEQTRASCRKLRIEWSNASESARYGLAFWIVGLTLMGGAIITQFGWAGFAFCVGLLLWTVSNHQPSE